MTENHDTATKYIAVTVATIYTFMTSPEVIAGISTVIMILGKAVLSGGGSYLGAEIIKRYINGDNEKKKKA